MNHAKGTNSQSRRALPNDVDVDSLIEKLYLLRRLELADEEIATGKTVDHEEDCLLTI